MSVEEKLAGLGLRLPEMPSPAGAYVRAVRVHDLLFISGQLPWVAGELKYRGAVGADLTVEDGYEASRICALNALSVVKGEAGSLERIARIVRVAGFIRSAPGFEDQPKVLNGASELLAEVLGEIGKHSRLAVGVADLPLGAAVELELIAQIGEEAPEG
ncbi:MAG: RidA family protein [Chloroflexi bacterium]|nr:RidA family protein [Chloroflexota bacterium]